MSPWQKPFLKKVLPVLLAFFFISALMFFRGNESQSNGAKSVKWNPYESAISKAKSNGKSVYLYFYTDQCPYCRKMEMETFTDREVVATLDEHFLSVRVDVNRKSKLSGQYPLPGVPASWFLDSQGERVGYLPGYMHANDFTKVLVYIGEKYYKSMDLKEYLEKSD